MSGYRVYFVNGQGRFVRAVELLCRDDEEATAHARDLADEQAVELWDRARLVARFERRQPSPKL